MTLETQLALWRKGRGFKDQSALLVRARRIAHDRKRRFRLDLPMLSRIERGERKPTFIQLVILSAALDVTPVDFIEGWEASGARRLNYDARKMRRQFTNGGEK